MATFSKLILSASTDGRGIAVAATSSPGTTVHTASTVATDMDEVWIYAQNTDIGARKLSLEFGGVTSPNDLIEVTVPGESGLLLVVPGLILKGNVSPLVVRAFCSSGANLLTVHGYINRIS